VTSARPLLPLLASITACAAAPAPPPAPAPSPPVAVVAPATSVAPPPPPAPLPPLSELELTTHRALFDALRAHDSRALAALYTPDAVVHLGMGLPDANGPDAVAALAEQVWAAFPDSKTQWGALVQAGPALAVELGWTGTHTGPFGAFAPTKKVIGTSALALERFAPDGRIAQQRLYFDADALATDLASREGKARAFDGLPTVQRSALDKAEASVEDAPVIQAVMGAFGRAATDGAPVASVARGPRLRDLSKLGGEESLWVDETRRHTTSGKGAVPAWAQLEARMTPAKGEAAVDAWGTGPFVVLEWSEPGGEPRAAELLRVEHGKIAVVHTYRPPAPRKAR